MKTVRTDRKQLPVLSAQAASSDAAAAGVVRNDVDAPHVRVGFVTLGCDKNTVDSERMLARLLGAGASIAERPEEADVVVVNTCGFIESAKEESIEAILDAARLKADGQVRAVVAAGCLVQRYRDELSAEMPEVDLFLSLSEADRLVPELKQRGLLPERAVPTMERPLRVITSRLPHTSYLKISEGCDHSCAFCAIPLMRGKFRSTPMDVLVGEARELAAAGVKELNIVSQDTTWYGRDWRRGHVESDEASYFMGRGFEGMAGPRPSESGSRVAAGAADTVGLEDLLRRLVAETEIPWLRLFYMYPSGITRALVDLMAAEPRILPYLDMPIQHGSDAVLTRMRRPERRATILERVGWLRDSIPDLALRTTVIVGFPGETEDDFEQLLDLLERVRFDQVGAFAYSVEEGTRAADMADQVPDSVKRERLERLGDLQRAISLERNEARIGRVVPALIDRLESDGGAVGRTAAQALEVDGVTLIRGAAAAGLRAGRFADVRIVDALDQDVIAEPVAS
mgnify:CR=1 FL=1